MSFRSVLVESLATVGGAVLSVKKALLSDDELNGKVVDDSKRVVEDVVSLCKSIGAVALNTADSMVQEVKDIGEDVKERIKEKEEERNAVDIENLFDLDDEDESLFSDEDDDFDDMDEEDWEEDECDVDNVDWEEADEDDTDDFEEDADDLMDNEVSLDK